MKYLWFVSLLAVASCTLQLPALPVGDAIKAIGEVEGREIIASKLLTADVSGTYLVKGESNIGIDNNLTVGKIERFYKWNKGIIRIHRKGSSGSFRDHWSFGDEDITLYIVHGGRNIAFGPTTTKSYYGNFAIRNQDLWSRVTDIEDGELFGIVIARED